VSIALLGRGDDARVDQLPGHGEVALGAELPVEQLEQAFDHGGLGQRLAEGPDRVRIRHRIAPQASSPLRSSCSAARGRAPVFLELTRFGGHLKA
jgi:hypothetical protein